MDQLRSCAPGQPPAVARTARSENPAAFAQQRLWLAHTLSDKPAIFNGGAAFRITGNIDVRALEWSMATIIQRHEILRTSFRFGDDALLQCVAAAPSRILSRVELRSCDPSVLEESLRQLVARPFDLDHAPLFRCGLLEFSATEVALIFVAHHIVCDGISIGIFTRELETLYAKALGANRSGPVELSLQYGDYARAQVEAAQSRTAARAFWRDKLAGAPERVEFGSRPARNVVQEQTFAIPASHAALVRRFARHHRVTPFMLFQALWCCLLFRYTGQEDMVSTAPISCRDSSGLSDLIGIFINLLPLRIEPRAHLSFSDYLARVRRVCLDAYRHQELPFQQMLETQGGKARYLQLLFGYQRNDQSQLSLLNARTERIKLPLPGLEAELAVSVQEEQGGWEWTVRAQSDVLAPTVWEHLPAHLLRLLDSAIESPHLKLYELPLQSERERRQLCENGDGGHTGGYDFVHRSFEEQAAQQPEAIAAAHRDLQITYGELNARANVVAHALRRLGAGPETVVALLIERSFHVLVVLLGILKAGAAYLPLDPTHPADRLEYMLQCAGCGILMTQSKLRSKVSGYLGKTILVDSLSDERFSHLENPRVELTFDNLAYVIFTSGSTGKPKGVMVSHGNLASFQAAMKSLGPITSSDRILAITTLCFDIATLELLFPLAVGAKVVICDHEISSDPAQLAQAIEGHSVTVVQGTPATWRALVDWGWEGKIAKILCGGEALSPALAASLRTRADAVWNLYGPTETTIWSSAARLDSNDVVHAGMPLANTRFRILDQSLNLTPWGGVGELYISGPAVARGYIGRPDLTAERFVPWLDGERWYRTGDLARYLPDGELELLGRVDHQVKIRGFRIELGEIEACLAAHDQISAALVTSFRYSEGDERLVAYLVAHGNHCPETSALRSFLSRRLPDYMLPAHYVVLPSFPLSANGKVDRSRLPEPSDATLVSAGSGKARDITEELVAGIAAQVLGVDDVERDANFFALGGNSLLAVRLIARIRDAFHVEIPLRRFFENPSVDHVTRAIQSEALKSTDCKPLAISSNARYLDSPLSFAQQRLWVSWKLEPASNAYVLFAALRLLGELNVSDLEAAFDQILARHEPLRTRFAYDAPFSFIDKPSPTRIPIVDFTEGSSEWLEQHIRLLVADKGFDLARAWPWRCAVVRIAPNCHILAIAIHHIAFDDASVSCLIEEIEAIYNSRRIKIPTDLPTLPVTYRDYTRWQKESADGERSLAYWRKQLDGLPPLDLPAHESCQRSSGDSTVTYFRQIKPQLAMAIRKFSRQCGSTPFMTAVAGIQVMLARYARQPDFAIGVPVSGRLHHDLESVIGTFVNTVMIRVDLHRDPSFREVLQRVRATMIEALVHQDLPVDRLIASLRDETGVGDHPFFRVLVVQQQARKTPSLRGLEAEWLPPGDSQARVDLEFTITETEQRVEIALRCRRPFEAVAREFLSHWECLMTTAVANPDLPVWTIGFLPDEQRSQLVHFFNDTSFKYEELTWAHRQFERRVGEKPGNTALRFEGRTVTYKELNSRANQLARRLIHRGIGRGNIVGVVAVRSVEMVVALLAILKTGAAYLPLDPNTPLERVSFITADGGVRVLLAAGVDVSSFADLDLSVIDVRSEEESALAEDDHDIGTYISSLDLAYVIYTSGSTGRPKGVMITHEALHNRLEWMQQHYALTSDDAVLQKTPYTFDVSVWEFFWPLTTGATLVIARPEGHGNPMYLCECMAANRVTTVHFVPSMLRAFLDGISELPATVRRVFSSGEELPRDLCELFISRCSAELHNLYGPTEATVDVSYWDCRRGSPATSVPIGSPISNIQIHILDHWMNLMPVGIPGELFIGGTGLARGYLNRPDLTAERFLPDPFSPTPCARLYRTGDLARRLDDGSIEFLERIDDQVKIRGFRIEPGEVRATILTHRGVTDAAVITQLGPDRRPRLVAYVCANSHFDLSDLRVTLESRLPDYMIPAAFVILDKMPANANGKLDRKALPQPQWGVTNAQTSAGPLSSVESVLAEIWARVLQIPKVGRHDNFFHLGGDSIMGIQIANRAARVGLRIAPADLFAHPTIAELAQHSPLPPEPSKDGISSAPLTPIQEWYLSTNPASPHHFNQALLCEFLYPAVVQDVERAVLELVARHQALGLRFEQRETGWNQSVAPYSTEGVFSRIDLSNIIDWRRAGLTLAAQIQSSLNIFHGPVFRAVMFKNGWRQPDRLLFVAHHLVIDGLSWRILIDDLHLELRRPSNEATAVPSTTSYPAWSLYLRQLTATGEFDSELEFWVSQAKEPGLLPRDGIGANLERSSRRITSSFELESRQRFLRAGASIQELQLAALVVALNAWTRQSTIRVDLEGHGRDHQIWNTNVLATVGWFTSLYPLAFHLAPGKTEGPQILSLVREHLRRVRHGGMGYGALRFHTASGRDLLRYPPADLCFNYMGQIENTLEPNSLLRIVHEPLSNLRNVEQRRPYAIEFNSFLDGHRVEVVWTYSSDLFYASTIQRVAGFFAASFKSLIDAADEREQIGYLPSSDLTLSGREMSQLMDELEEP